MCCKRILPYTCILSMNSANLSELVNCERVCCVRILASKRLNREEVRQCRGRKGIPEKHDEKKTKKQPVWPRQEAAVTGCRHVTSELSCEGINPTNILHWVSEPANVIVGLIQRPPMLLAGLWFTKSSVIFYRSLLLLLYIVLL